MNSERLTKVIVGPIVTEKTSRTSEHNNQVAFKVLPDAHKHEIRQAVERLFGVKVIAVTTAHVRGKLKRTGRILGRRYDWKKAYVSLAEGADIDFLDRE